MIKKLLLFATALVTIQTLNAQENFTSAGNESNGSNGSVNYSIGQTFYTTDIGSTGSINKGLQQPYIISSTEIDESLFDIELNIYPNPTTNYLELNIEDQELNHLTYQLIDLNGKVIESKKVVKNNTKILMENLPKSTYFLKVQNEKNKVKTFQIIKQ
jgi:hypothetical protein